MHLVHRMEVNKFDCYSGQSLRIKAIKDFYVRKKKFLIEAYASKTTDPVPIRF